MVEAKEGKGEKDELVPTHARVLVNAGLDASARLLALDELFEFFLEERGECVRQTRARKHTFEASSRSMEGGRKESGRVASPVNAGPRTSENRRRGSAEKGPSGQRVESKTSVFFCGTKLVLRRDSR